MTEQQKHVDAVALLVAISVWAVCIAIILFAVRIATMVSGDRLPRRVELSLRLMTADEVARARRDALARQSTRWAGAPVTRPRPFDRDLLPDWDDLDDSKRLLWFPHSFTDGSGAPRLIERH